MISWRLWVQGTKEDWYTLKKVFYRIPKRLCMWPKVSETAALKSGEPLQIFSISFTRKENLVGGSIKLVFFEIEYQRNTLNADITNQGINLSVGDKKWINIDANLPVSVLENSNYSISAIPVLFHACNIEIIAQS